MVRGLDPELSKRLGAIQHSPIAVVGFGYRRAPRELDGFGLLTTTSAKQPVLGVLWDSSIFPDRAPAGGAALRAMLGGQRSPELVDQDDAGLIACTRAGIRNTMGVDCDPDVTYIRRWPRGIPSYTPGHVDRVEAIFDQLGRWPGLHVNCNAYRGIAMNDCSRNARELAERITA
jgi:oxygen-dependent protoporphyrinogen oxidase